MKICPKCKIEKPFMSKFCSQCGELLKELNKKVCYYCKVQLQPEDKFCDECGKEIKH